MPIDQDIADREREREPSLAELGGKCKNCGTMMRTVDASFVWDCPVPNCGWHFYPLKGRKGVWILRCPSCDSDNVMAADKLVAQNVCVSCGHRWK